MMGFFETQILAFVEQLKAERPVLTAVQEPGELKTTNQLYLGR